MFVSSKMQNIVCFSPVVAIRITGRKTFATPRPYQISVRGCKPLLCPIRPQNRPRFWYRLSRSRCQQVHRWQSTLPECTMRRGNVDCTHQHDGDDPSCMREFHILMKDLCITCFDAIGGTNRELFCGMSSVHGSPWAVTRQLDNARESSVPPS